MQIARRTAVALVMSVAFAGSTMTAASALAAPVAPHFHPLLKTTLVPSVPTDPSLHGVTAGGAPWVLRSGTFRLRSNGEVRVKIRGLIIPELGTPGPVTSVDASLYCANEMTPAFTTASAPLSTAGNALIETTVSLPPSCLTPVVLINPNGISSIYIGTSGFNEAS